MEGNGGVSLLRSSLLPLCKGMKIHTKSSWVGNKLDGFILLTNWALWKKCANVQSPHFIQCFTQLMEGMFVFLFPNLPAIIAYVDSGVSTISFDAFGQKFQQHFWGHFQSITPWNPSGQREWCNRYICSRNRPELLKSTGAIPEKWNRTLHKKSAASISAGMHSSPTLDYALGWLSNSLI